MNYFRPLYSRNSHGCRLASRINATRVKLFDPLKVHASFPAEFHFGSRLCAAISRTTGGQCDEQESQDSLVHVVQPFTYWVYGREL